MIVNIIKARQSFAEMAELDDAAFPLDRVALTLAMEEYPGLDLLQYLKRLDTLAARAEVLIGRDRTPAGIIECINEVLFVQEGLRGNSEDYYNPQNYYLNEVLDRKLGIPITLSVVYMEVAKRIGFPIAGLGFPEHFLVKHMAGDREIIIDPFNLGRTLTMKDCQELLDKMGKSDESMNPTLLQPMGNRAIITRILYNLKGIYEQNEQDYEALSVIEKILLLNPGIPSEVRDRGLLYMQAGLFAKALSDLEYYLAHSTGSRDLSSIKNHNKTLRDIVCAVN
ncbi:MAG: transglutaminase family protein [Acidobacteria bacterium]|nr:transglutaminase family protein [Acidobacteriota bacterium]